MFPINIILSPVVFLLSLSTAAGVFVHDMQLDKATVTALSLPVMLMSYDHAGLTHATENHTHIERGPLSQALHDLKSTTPRMLPRDDHRKHVLAKRVVRGVHAFDGYYMPLGEL